MVKQLILLLLCECECVYLDIADLEFLINEALAHSDFLGFGFSSSTFPINMSVFRL